MKFNAENIIAGALASTVLLNTAPNMRGGEHSNRLEFGQSAVACGQEIAPKVTPEQQLLSDLKIARQKNPNLTLWSSKTEPSYNSRCEPENKDITAVWSGHSPEAGQEPTYNRKNYEELYRLKIRRQAVVGIFGEKCTSPDQIMGVIKTGEPEAISKIMSEKCKDVKYSKFGQGEWKDYTITQAPPALETPKDDKKQK